MSSVHVVCAALSLFAAAVIVCSTVVGRGRQLSPWRSVSLIVRSFTRAKGFTIVALLVVALGVGVNAVVFSLFDRVLFRPLPYGEPNRLVQLRSEFSSTRAGEPVMRYAIALALARDTDTFSGIAWANGGDPEPLMPVPGENPLFWLTGVTTNTLDVLGIHPVIGPAMSAFPATAQERPVLLTYDVWQHRYGASSDVLSLAWTTRDAGQRDIHWRVVGVLPRDFRLPSPRFTTAPFDGIYGVDPRLDRQLSLDYVDIAPFARLAPGVSRAGAQVRVNVLVRSRFPRTPTPYGFQPTTVSVVPLQSGLSTVAQPYAWLAVVGAWTVLGVTCLTLAILLLTWSQSRRRDAGVRLAIGASPRRLVTTAILESTLLCGAGAVLAWLAYVWTRPLFVNALPTGLQALATEAVDVRVMAVAGTLALVSAIAGAILPAIRTSRMAPLDILRPSRDVFGRIDGAPILLGVQAAFGVVLVVGTLAILPGVVRTLLAPPGFDASDLFTISVPTSNDATASDAREQTRRGLAALEVVRRSPGVVGAALSTRSPFRPEPVERAIDAGLLPNLGSFDGLIRAADAGFFRTLGAPLRAGRAFSQAEVEQQAPVAILNETGARALWPDLPVESAIGRTVTGRDVPRAVIGVVADFRVGIETPARPTLFLPLSDTEAYAPAGSAFPWSSYQVFIRMAPGRVPDGALLSEHLRREPWMIPNWVGVTGPSLTSVLAELDSALERPRLLALIFVTLAAVTLVLTTIAMYGLASFEIRRRREEMTVRLALGATPPVLRRRLALVIATPVAIGALAGVPFAWVQVRLIGLSLSFVDASAPSIYLVAAAVVVTAALVAAWLPGRRFFRMRVAELLRA